MKVGDSSKVVGGMSWGLAGFQGLLMLLSVYLMCTRYELSSGCVVYEMIVIVSIISDDGVVTDTTVLQNRSSTHRWRVVH